MHICFPKTYTDMWSYLIRMAGRVSKVLQFCMLFQ